MIKVVMNVTSVLKVTDIIKFHHRTVTVSSTTQTYSIIKATI